MKRLKTSLNLNKYDYWLGALIVIATLVVFWPVLGNGFIDLDDNVHITANPVVQAGLTLHGIRWAFTTLYSDLWNPLTWLSEMLDCQIYGLQPWGHHLTSLLLHAANALGLFLLWRRMTGSSEQSAVAACLFALHPLRVESVAFAAERKDVLSGFFWMATLWFYWRYVEAPSWKRYAAALAAYALDLMSKPMVVSMPIVLLLVDFWPLGRFQKRPLKILVAEKLPFAVLAFAVCAITMAAQKSFIIPQARFPWYFRIGSAAVFYCQYLGKIFWPQKLALFYRHPGLALPAWQMLAAMAFLAAITIAAAMLRRRYPYLLMGWLWFLIVLIPVIGIVQISGRSIADRFTYLPQIGLCFIVAWGGAEIAGKIPQGRNIWRMLIIAVMAACAFRTRDQLHYWRNPRLLYEQTLEISPGNELIHNVLGVYLAKHGDLEQAKSHFEEAIRLQPQYADAYNNLGFLLYSEGKRTEAVLLFKEALRINPQNEKAQYNLEHLSNEGT